MRLVHAAFSALVLFELLTGQAHAAGIKHWSSSALQLGLSYPREWRVVAEQGAALKLLAPDAAGEFEIFSMPAPLSPGALTARIDRVLARLHCAVTIRHTFGTIGHLGLGGTRATGICTGGDQGWKLTVTAFNYRSGAILLRSWLFHGQSSDNAALTAIAASLSVVHP